jgi:tRNA modification GTPase
MMKIVDTFTIAAISTPAGTGGIAVIRISGENAFEICDKIFVSANGKRMSEKEPDTVTFGKIIPPHLPISDSSDWAGVKTGVKTEVIDEVLVTVFRSPRSFTGEDMVEISCHGSLFIQQEILKLLINNGCRLARAGEFTQRAFLNGKMDLSQAEAVADLIASQSAAAHDMAMNQMRGGFSAELKKMRARLLDFVSLIELDLDFSQEDVQFADREQLSFLAKNIVLEIESLTNSFSLGNVLKNGISVALVGETNVGKSTLLNLLLNEERAIVSDIHGTTRDVIEDTVNIQGIMFRFIDTAGIRKTKDTVENLGIERTYQKIEQAQIVLWLVDGTRVSEHIEWLTEKILKRAKDKKVILVFNKIDKISAEELEILNSLFEPFDCERIKISAKKRINTEKLHQALLRAANTRLLPASSASVGENCLIETDMLNNMVIVSNIRHYEALMEAQSALLRVQDGLERGISGEFLSHDIRQAMHCIGEITGEITTDEVLGNIFGKFCIGK